MRLAHELASACLPRFSSKFSRHDFTLVQLFACLVVREHMRLSYRRTEAVLRDTDWCARLGMTRVPDHATLCRAFDCIVMPGMLDDALDLLVDAMNRSKATGQTLAVDSTMYDTHHFTRHYERRRSQHAGGNKNVIRQRKSETARGMPKLGIGVDTRSHLIAREDRHGKRRAGLPRPDDGCVLPVPAARGAGGCGLRLVEEPRVSTRPHGYHVMDQDGSRQADE